MTQSYPAPGWVEHDPVRLERRVQGEHRGELQYQQAVSRQRVFRLPSNLVAVTPDGLIHVLDGDQLALVSYLPDGELLGVAFLPRGMRLNGLVTKGLVLDLERLEAIPLVVPAGQEERLRLRGGVYLDGLDRVVLNPRGSVGLETAPVRLVAGDG